MVAILELPMRISAALIHESGIQVRRVVDVGSGPGTFLRILLEEFPDAEGVWIDASDAMLARAEESLADLAPRVTFAVGDLREARSLPLSGDVIVSARAVHHFLPETIEGFYRASREALSPGGFLCNLDHFATPGDWRERYKTIKRRFVPSSGGGSESHTHDSPPQLVRDHLEWLHASGFADPDVPWRLFWTALLVARAPSS
jgi:cyclopropane fatty-acyl-phospholipid synthase-like methyltransferase